MKNKAKGECGGAVRGVSLRFGDCNNGLACGGRYLNFNNAAANANWNIGSAWFYQPKEGLPSKKAAAFPTPLAVEIRLTRHNWYGEW